MIFQAEREIFYYWNY